MPPNNPHRKLTRLDYAARSKPAAKRAPGEPDGLVTGTHTRGYLPHVKVAGASYFVTFRLVDSLPQTVLERLIREREEHTKRLRAIPPDQRASAVAQASGLPYRRRPAGPPETDPEQLAQELFDERLNAYLDTGHGACWLKQPAVAEMVANAVRFFEGTRYHLHAWVVMPNHVHVVVRPTPSYSLSSIEHSWKSFTAKKANELLRRDEPDFWQHESYDHWIRDDEELVHFCHYTVMNPVNARLCAGAEDWVWSSVYRPQT